MDKDLVILHKNELCSNQALKKVVKGGKRVEKTMNKPSLEKTLLSEQLAHYRLQRHDFLNQWQVVMGYLQLDKGEQALSYMREGFKGFAVEQKIGQIPQEIVAASFLGFVITLGQENIPLNIKYAEPLSRKEFWQEFWQEEYGDVLYGYTKECLASISEQYKGLEEPNVEITLNNGVNLCNVSLLDKGKVVWEKDLVF